MVICGHLRPASVICGQLRAFVAGGGYSTAIAVIYMRAQEVQVNLGQLRSSIWITVIYELLWL